MSTGCTLQVYKTNYTPRMKSKSKARTKAKAGMPAKLYKIESGIKVPPPAVSKGTAGISATGATMMALEKAQSFIINDPLAALKASKIVIDFGANERKRGGTRKFTTRKVGDGLRIWRVQ